MEFNLKGRPTKKDGVIVIELYPSPYVRFLEKMPKVNLIISDETEVRSLAANSRYWVIVRQIQIEHEARTGEYMPEAAIHKYNLQYVLGLEPTIIHFDGKEIETFDFNRKKEELSNLGISFTNTQLKSSTMPQSLFLHLTELVIKHFSEKDYNLQLDDT